ncbi:CENP-B homolog protein 2-like [Apium graveolens]|uniref:CENP-B homolog protein 2-like n=1 Tax=Apium graveolens TaxID=4045 RepID=UPI003D79FEB1
MVTYPLMETTLLEWVHTYQTKINITSDLVKEKGAFFLNKLYSGANLSDFSNGWLERFKQRHGIDFFRRFGESGTVDMQAVEDVIPSLKNVLDQYDWKAIYNMDETGLFYRLQLNFIF